MSHYKIRFALILCGIFMLTSAFVFSHLPKAALKAADSNLPPVIEPVLEPEQELAASLAQAELALENNRAELALLLKKYYLGQAGEAETARLIRQTEQQRLLVEELRAELSAYNEGG